MKTPLHYLPILMMALPGTAGCTATPQASPGSRATSSSERSLVVEHAPTFTAYFGGADFDADVVLRVSQPEIVFHALEGPLSELDGETRVVDLSEPSDWVVMNNLHYGADTEDPWYLLAVRAGTPGLSGQVTVRGRTSPLAVEVQYDVGFDGEYELPGFAEVPEVHLRWANAGFGSADDVSRER